MTTQPAPLLTAARAAHLLACPSDATLDQGLQALADGRTACVRVMSEEECRAEFEDWYEKAFFHNDGTEREPTREEVWLACARAMGAVR